MTENHDMPVKLDEKIFKVHPKYADVIMVQDPNSSFTCGHYTSLLVKEIINRYNGCSDLISMIQDELPLLYKSAERLANMGTQMAIAGSNSISARIEVYESILKMFKLEILRRVNHE